MRYYNIHHRPGAHLTLWQRQLLQQDWNRAIREGRHPTIRGFACEENPDDRIPCVRTWYYHIAHGDIGVKYGETPYHSKKKRRKHPSPHPAKTVPGCPRRVSKLEKRGLANCLDEIRGWRRVRL